MKINSRKEMDGSCSRLKKLLLLLLTILFAHSLISQTVPEPTSNNAIYTFLDEMANLKIIELNDVIKPYSRITIYEKLQEVAEKTGLEKSADEDSVFTAAFQIIYGASMTVNENGNLNYTYGGASLSGYLGKNSSRSYWTNNTCRIVYYQKYMAANMFTFYPFKGFNFSIGNSIIYTNESGGGPLAAYLIPFLFYKSVDITLSSYEIYGYASNNNQ